MQTVLAGFGEHPQAGPALHWAEDLARVEEADLVVMSVFDPPFAEVDPELHDEMFGDQVLEADLAVADVSNLETQTDVREGRPREVLAREAELVDADLVVIAKDDAVGPDGFGLDGPRHWLLHHSQRPVAVVTPNPPGLSGHPIVVGVDGSRANRGALRMGEELAAATGNEVVAVFAYDPIDETYTHRDGWHQHSDETRREVAMITAAPTEFVMRAGDPKEVLCEVAEERHAAAIVVGTKGMASLHGRLVGRVPTHLLDSSPCPFIVVPHDGTK